ncbi:MAG: GntR family transcriptional regulator [Brevinema sp.]
MVPKYLEIISILEDRIKNDFYKKGEILPTEQIFCNEFSVSRMTIRKILRELISKGRIFQIKNRGVFVSYFQIEMISNFKGFSTNMIANGFKVVNPHISVEIKPAPKYIASQLGIQESDNIIIIERYRTINDEPIQANYIYLSHQKFQGFEHIELENTSIYHVFKNNFHRQITQSEQKVSTAMLMNNASLFLFGKSKDIALKVEATNYDQNNEIISYEETYYNGHKFKISFILNNTELDHA